MEIREQDVKEFAKTKIKELTKELQKWQHLLDAFGDNKEIQNELFPKANDKSINSLTNLRIKSNPSTLRERCEKILFEKDTPLTSRDLMSEVESRYNKKYDFYAFSGAFSQSYRNKNSMITKFDLPNPLKDVKTVYCLKNWFVNDELLNGYKIKLTNKYGVDL